MTGDSPILRSPGLQWLLVQIFPRLRDWPVREWPALLSGLQAMEFDRIERLGIVAGVVFATWLLQPNVPAEASAGVVYLTQLLLALPLLALLVGPFFLRRIRRGLEEAARGRR